MKSSLKISLLLSCFMQIPFAAAMDNTRYQKALNDEYPIASSSTQRIKSSRSKSKIIAIPPQGGIDPSQLNQALLAPQTHDPEALNPLSPEAQSDQTFENFTIVDSQEIPDEASVSQPTNWPNPLEWLRRRNVSNQPALLTEADDLDDQEAVPSSSSQYLERQTKREREIKKQQEELRKLIAEAPTLLKKPYDINKVSTGLTQFLQSYD